MIIELIKSIVKTKGMSVLVTILFINFAANANMVKTKCEGEWGDLSIWFGNQIPKNGDSIEINHSVRLTEDVRLDNVYFVVGENGYLTGEHDVTVNYSELYNYGYIDLKGNYFNIHGGGESYGIFRGGRRYTAEPNYRSQRGFYTYGTDRKYFHYDFPFIPTYEITACGGYSTPSGKIWDSTGVYLDTLQGVFCDSIYRIELYIPKDTVTRTDTSVCDEYVMGDGSFVYETGVYERSLQNQCGLDSVVEHHIEVLDCKNNCGLYFPNVFTPDGDGLNDYFLGKSICHVNIYNLKILDRWRNVIFESSDQYVGWDGTFMSAPVMQGMYVYFIDYQIQDDQPYRQRSGTVLLVR